MSGLVVCVGSTVICTDLVQTKALPKTTPVHKQSTLDRHSTLGGIGGVGVPPPRPLSITLGPFVCVNVNTGVLRACLNHDYKHCLGAQCDYHIYAVMPGFPIYRNYAPGTPYGGLKLLIT